MEAAHDGFMRAALEQAGAALREGEVPVGAVLVREGAIVARAFNRPIGSVDPTSHAEVTVLREAARGAGNYRLPGSTLYVTIEPCLMCVGALVNARVGTLVYGAPEPKWGAVRSLLRLSDLTLNHRFQTIGGVLEAECAQLMVEFFQARR